MLMAQPESSPEQLPQTLESIDQIFNDSIVSELLSKLQDVKDAEAKLWGDGISFRGEDEEGRISRATLRLESHQWQSIAELTFTFPQTIQYGFSSFERAQPTFYIPDPSKEGKLGLLRRALLSQRVKDLQPVEPHHE